MLELDDGTRLAQSKAILAFIGKKYKLVPEDPVANYKGQVAESLFWDDYFNKIVHKAFWASENRAQLMEELTTKHTPEYFRKLETCLGDSKFLCGDEVTIYDIQVAGFFTNLVLNPKSKDPALWAKVWENTPVKIKTYVDNFKAEFKEYLEKRAEKDCTM